MSHPIEARLQDPDVSFDEDLADEVVRSNDDRVFLAALRRRDCPAGLSVDLSQAPNPQVRLAVARHPNTPAPTLRRMSADPNADVARAASRRSP